MNGGSRPQSFSSMISSSSVWLRKPPGSVRSAPPDSLSSSGCSWCYVVTVLSAMLGPATTASP